jgi:type VI protein secretion system component VasF
MKSTISEQNESKIMHLISDIIFYAKAFKKLPIDDDQKIIDHRNEIVSKLLDFKNTTYPIYGAMVTDMLYAAIIYFIDEVVHEGLNFKKWHLLQEELLNCNDGGQHFFELCQQVVDNPSLPIITHKTLYMILANKYRGIYYDDVNKRNMFKQKLHYYIEQNDYWINSFEELSLSPILHFEKNQWYNRLNRRYFTNVTIGLFGLSVAAYIGVYFSL